MKGFDSSAQFKFVGLTPFTSEFLSLPLCGTTGGTITVFPGFCDVHVHFREPGFSYKETMRSGSLAAARGGYTAVCTMPNLNPVPDSREHLQEQLDFIEKDARIAVFPYGSITEGQKGERLAALEETAPFVIAFSDDGKGVQSDEMMEEAMRTAKRLGKMIVAHCEVNDLLHGGYIHDGVYARKNGHPGISSASEYEQIRRDLQLVSKIDCPYHVCHISTKESVALIREAKRAGLNVTCETAPHYLVLDEGCLQEDGRFKMNPPLRAREDREALVQGLVDGTIDCIATDHAPHAVEEKNKGLAGSAFGIVGIETAVATVYTHLVKTGILSQERMVDALCHRPRERFGIPLKNDYSLWDLDREFTVRPEEFLSLGRSTPLEGERLSGVCLATICDGRLVYENRVKSSVV